MCSPPIVDTDPLIFNEINPCTTATETRRRPITSRASNFDNRCPIPVARGRKENRTILFQSRPLCGSNDVGIITGTFKIRIVQSIMVNVPVIRKQDHAIDVVHMGSYITNTSSCATGIEQIEPFFTSQRPPTAVFGVAAIADGIVAPVGLACLIK